MKKSLAILLLLVVGCSKAEELGSNQVSQKETSAKHTEKSSKNTNPVKELTIDDVVGSYDEGSDNRIVFLDNGVAASYVLLVDPREFLKDQIKDTEKMLANSIKEFGENNLAAKSFAEMLAKQKEKLAAAGPPEFPKDFDKSGDYKWEIKDGEVHLHVVGGISVLRMESNGDLTKIRTVFDNGTRIDIPKEKQKTSKKIK